MLSIPQAVRDAIETDGFLHFGLANRVLNLSKTARFIKPLIETRTKKQVSLSAITMALSRLRVHKHRDNLRFKSVKLDSLSITKNLIALTYDKTGPALLAHDKAIGAVRSAGSFIVSNVGTAEITTMLDASHERDLTKRVTAKPKKIIRDLVAIHAQFNLRYIEQVGMIYTLMQQLTFQNINIIEFSSTYTEIVFYLQKKDLKVAFDTLYDQFM